MNFILETFFINEHWPWHITWPKRCVAKNALNPESGDKISIILPLALGIHLGKPLITSDTWFLSFSKLRCG